MLRSLCLLLVSLLYASAIAQPYRTVDGGEPPYVYTPASDQASPEAPGMSVTGSGLVPIGAVIEHDWTQSMAVYRNGSRMVSSAALSGTVFWQESLQGGVAARFLLNSASLDVAVAPNVVAYVMSQPARLVMVQPVTFTVLQVIALPMEPARVRLSDDGSIAAVGMLDNAIAIVDTQTGLIQRTISAPFRRAGTRRFTRSNRTIQDYLPFDVTGDGARLVVGTADDVRSYDTASGALVASAALPGRASGVSLSDTGIAAVTAGGPFEQDPSLVFFDLETGTTTEVLLTRDRFFGDVIIRPDGSQALVLSGAEAVVVTPGATPEVATLAPAERLADIGRGKAAIWHASAVTRVDLASMATETTIPLPASAFPESASIISKGGNGSVLVWSFWTERAISADFDSGTLGDYSLGFALPFDAPRRLALSPDDGQVAVAHIASDRVPVLNAATRAIVASVSTGIRFPEDVGYISEDTLIVVGNQEVGLVGELMVYDLANREIVQRAIVPGQDANSVFVLPERNRVFVHSVYSQLLSEYEITVDGLSLLRTHAAGGRPIVSMLSSTPLYIGISPTGTHSVGIDTEGDPTIAIVDLVSGVRTDIPANYDADQIAFTADGTRAGVAGWDGQFYLLDLTGTPSLISETTLPFATSAIAYDQSEDVFVVGSIFSPEARLGRIDPQTGHLIGEDLLPSDFEVHGLLWDAATGVVATGQWRQPDGSRGGGAVVTSLGYTKAPEVFGQSVVLPRTNEVMSTVPGLDAAFVANAVPVAISPSPEASAYTLTPLANPSPAGVRVRMSGPASAHARVEVVDVLGRVVARLHDGPFAGGAMELALTDVAPGAYLVRLAGEGVVTRTTVVR